jgi:uncharacterized surface protein with fasciclin (FAS1) repeats
MKVLTTLALAAAIAATPAALEGQAPYPKEKKAMSTMNATQAPGMDIVETAVAAGSFNTLATALKSAGLVDALKGKGPFTVFAPTDAAFAKLPKGTVEALLQDKEKLTAILTYHVVSGEVPASQVVKMTSAGTLNGQNVRIMVKEGKVMVNNATVTQADVEASNGIIHVIDTVLLPE